MKCKICGDEIYTGEQCNECWKKEQENTGHKTQAMIQLLKYEVNPEEYKEFYDKYKGEI
jgi:hypothetical protein